MAEEAETTFEPEGTEAGASDQPKKSMLPLLLIAILVLGTAGVGAWLLARRSARAKTHPPSAKVEPKIKAVLHLESFVVNLADQNENAFLRVGMDIGLDKEMTKEDTEKQLQVMPGTRDTLLDVLTSYQSEELLAPDGKDKLKARLLQALQARMPEVGIREVYFTDFLVQR